MLVLSRKEGERILIGEGVDQVEIVVAYIRGDRVGIAVKAPNHVKIMRKELIERESGDECNTGAK
jgi:carbon storage regulator